ncbi:MAG: MarR family transcriptional regulator [Pseudomonadota bacterium]|nr:MarR family transcriptional regulator [Pseudomonadota bacterium]
MNRDPIDHFIEQMGFMTQEDGLPRIAGQVLGYLLVEGEPRTLAEITEALSISKASASTNCRQLADKGILTRVATRGSRADSYMAVTNPAEDMLAGMAARFRTRAGKIEEAAAGFPDSRAEARERVTVFANFFRTSADFLDEWTERAQRQMADTE